MGLEVITLNPPSPAFIFCGNLTQPEAMQGLQHTYHLVSTQKTLLKKKKKKDTLLPLQGAVAQKPGTKSKYIFLFIPHHSNIEIWP